MIKKITKQYLPDIIKLFHQLWPDLNLSNNSVEDVLDIYINDSNYEIYCYEEEIQSVKTMTGLITVSKRYDFYYSGKIGIIEELIIDEKHRSKGIGKKLVEFIENLLIKNNCKAIELSSNLHRTRAHNFWKKMGYEQSAYLFRKFI